MESRNEQFDCCLVCEEKPSQNYYGARCCASCKRFFRRNFQLDLSKEKCSFGNECQITIKTRHACRYCRLKKCFSIGMNKDFIRASYSIGKKKTKNSLKISNIRPINLLENDVSLLTFNQWSILSNINNSYDNRSLIPKINKLIYDQFTYPIELRIEITKENITDIISSAFLFIDFFFLVNESCSIDTIKLFHIQNIYIELTFKYMLYRYGYDQAALRLANLIRIFLYQSNLTAHAAEIARHEVLLQKIMGQTEQLLQIDN